MAWGKTGDKLAQTATLLVSIAGCAVDPTGMTATSAAATSYLSLKDIFKASTPDAKKLVTQVTKDLHDALENPTFHMPEDGPRLLPQMLEHALPAPADLTGRDLNADGVIDEMLKRLTHSDYNKSELKTAYRAFLRPSLNRLLTDPTFVQTLGPEIARETLGRLTRLADALVQLSQDYGTLARSLEHMETMQQSQLEALALRFGLTPAPGASPADLLGMLQLKAEDAENYIIQIDALPDHISRVHNLKAAAKEAADALDFEKVDGILSRVDTVETEALADSKRARATNALMLGKTENAYKALSAAADAFANIDPVQPARRRIAYEDILYAHGLRYGSNGMVWSARMLRDAIAMLDRTMTPELWAEAQNSLAIALQNQGIRTDGPDGTALLAQAVTAYRDALTIYTKADHPVDWAMTTQNLAAALRNQGSRTDGPDGTALLAESVTAYRDALTIYTKAGHPVDWAMTTQNLAIALQTQGTRTDGPDGTALLAQAVTAYRDALTVYTKADHPVRWAMTTQNLATALQDQGIRTDGPDGAALLAEAVAAYREALTIRTKADHPVQWATTTQNLATALQDQGTRTDGPDGTALLAKAVTACRDALSVYTKADHPVHWAMTMRSMAMTEEEIADHGATDTPLPHLRNALSHIDDALTVFDAENTSYEHASATRVRDRILAKIAATDD